ncbi:MAG: hypothetical protein NZ561_01415, partial [Phycisphaerae bacterium]|nr:hypothetical protein [Phycisphaerae bacterium]
MQVRPVISLVVYPSTQATRLRSGLNRLSDALRNVGFSIADVDPPAVTGALKLTVSVRDPVVGAAGLLTELRPEGFAISRDPEAAEIRIIGGDSSGAMYGCLELARLIQKAGSVPNRLSIVEHGPQFTLRGPAIGLQKTFILPGRKVYEYPITPELFPFFYDREHWTEYLDFLWVNRFNTLFLWSGHPFSSLVRSSEYPDVLEVDEATFHENVRTYRWLADECDRRGIWLVQSFYSILLPQPLAQRHGLDTQLSAPNEVAADYTRNAIAAFVREYPNVGLMPCLGEALVGIENQKFWLNEVILAGIKAGMAAAGLTEQPPVVVRTHATDARQIMPAALKVYRNLYTEAKFNGESLTTWEPRGVRQSLHQAMSALGATHVVNVHILANLEPFRYGAQRFIRKCMQAARDRLGARGLHLYPLTFWDWPFSPDRPPLRQIDRDWIWFESWARYAWNPDIDEHEDRNYWITRLTEHFGSAGAAERILNAYNDAGECAPRLLRRFGITEGNRQTLSLGMTLDQLTAPEKYRPFPELWESQSPPGERLQEFVEREWKKLPHEGETPVTIISEVLDFASRAQAAVESAAGLVTLNRPEFERLRNDVHCIAAMSRCYAAKAKAAIAVLQFNFSRDVADLEQAAEHLADSLQHFRTLEALTRDTYRYANSMQTGQRKIPVSGGSEGKPVNFHWSQLLELYEQELGDFQRRIAAVRSGRPEADETTIPPLPKADFRVLSPGAQRYEVQIGAVVFTDRPAVILSLAPELAGLQGIRFAHGSAAAGAL